MPINEAAVNDPAVPRNEETDVGPPKRRAFAILPESTSGACAAAPTSRKRCGQPVLGLNVGSVSQSSATEPVA
jgi:hypothetical protein